MKTIDLRFDHHLTGFITDFADGNLDGVELQVFNEYLELHQPIRSFAIKVKKGREALSNHSKVKAADDFEEKLARRIALERASMIVKEERNKNFEVVS